MNKYTNYYNDENTMVSFTFNDMTEEEAKRIQAYILQDSHLIIYDEDILGKLDDSESVIDKTKPYVVGSVTINRDKYDRGHFIIEGTLDQKEDSKETSYRYTGDVFEGLNFVSVSGIRINTANGVCGFSSINWFHDKIYNPTKLTRFNIKTSLMANDPYDLENDDIEYTVSEEFDISHNPTEEFKNGKKKTYKVKVK